jgi:hypothetical protein
VTPVSVVTDLRAQTKTLWTVVSGPWDGPLTQGGPIMNTPTRPVDFPALRTHTAVELLDKELPPLSMIVGRHIPAGLLLLAGDPKVGKSLLMLSLGISVATNCPAWGEVAVPHGDVLYLVLEGGERSLRSRIEAMTNEGTAPERLHLAYECLNLGEGLATQIESWLYTVDALNLSGSVRDSG